MNADDRVSADPHEETEIENAVSADAATPARPPPRYGCLTGAAFAIVGGWVGFEVGHLWEWPGAGTLAGAVVGFVVGIIFEAIRPMWRRG